MPPVSILGGARVLLLDECTSALDEATENAVLSRIKAMENRTCIAITHRPAAITMSDIVLNFSDGKIDTVSTALTKK